MPWVVDAYGELGEVSDELAAEVLSTGGRPATPEELTQRTEGAKYGTLGEGLKGVGEQALSGATLGLSDVALSEIGGDEYRAAREARARQLGGIGTAAQVVGAVAPTLLTFGESTPLSAAGIAKSGVGIASAPVRAAVGAGRVAEGVAGAGLRGLGVTGESILGRGVLSAGKLAAGGAVEGAAFGAGQALSEAALAPGGDYDNLASKLLSGAGTGAGFGAIGGGLFGFVGGAGGRAIERGAAKLAGPGGLKDMLVRFSEERTLKALGARGTDLRKLGRTAETAEENMGQLARDVLEAKMPNGENVFKSGMKADDLAERVTTAKRSVGEELGALREQVKDAVVDVTSIRNTIRRDVIEPLEASLVPEIRARAGKVASTFEAIGQRDAMTLGELTELRKHVDDVVFPKPSGPGLPPLPPEHTAQLQAARRSLEDGIEAETEKALLAIAPDTAPRYGELKGKYRSLSQAEQIASKATLQDLGNRFFSPTDYATGGLAAAGALMGGAPALVAGAKGLAISALHNVVRERGSSVLAVMADRLARNDMRLSSAISGFLKKASNARRGVLGEGAAREVSEKSRVERMLGKRPAQQMADAYRKKVDQLSRYNPEADPSIPAVTSAAPNLAIAAIARMARARNYLIANAPGDPLGIGDVLQPQLKKALPNIVELDKWARRIEAVEDPIGVLSNGLKNGTITREHVETIKTVDPGLYQDVRGKLEDKLLESKERLPYAQRIRLGVLFELPTDPSLRPAQMARTQRMYAMQNQVKQDQKQAVSAPSSVDGAYQTEAQRVESGAAPQ